jgi:WD40 repeat protein
LYCAVFSPHGNVLYAGAFNQPILVVDTKERKVTGRIGKGAGHINALAASPDGALLAAAYEKGVLKVWDVKADREVYYFQAHISLRAISFVCKGQKLVSNGGGNDVLVHDLSHLAQVPRDSRPSDKP